MSVRELLPTATSRETWTGVRALFTGRWTSVAATVTVLVAGTVAGLLVPPLLGAIVDTVLSQGEVSRIDVLVLALAGAVLLEAALTGWGVVLVSRLTEPALASLREQVLTRALEIPLGEVEAAPQGDLVARVSGDVESVSDGLREALPQLVGAALTVGLTLVGLAVLDWRLALAGCAVLPVHVVATRWYLRRSSPVYASERIALGVMTSRLGESISGVRTVTAYRLSGSHRRQVDEASAVAVGRSLTAARLRSRFFASLNIAECVGLTSVLVVGFLAVRSDVVTVGAATAAALYFHRLFGPFNALLGLLDDAQDATAALARLVGITRTTLPPEPAQPARPVDASVEIVDARFGYQEGYEVLHGIDLALDPGEHVALVGPSGAGKTTLGKLVTGVHRPTTGEVYLGGSTHAELGSAGTRAQVSLVTQEVHVFAGTIAEDLRLAAPEATDADLLRALDTVDARGWLDAMPEGLDTVVGDGGFVLSALQSQQLALARLVLADRPIVILDEATAEAGSAGARVLEAAATSAMAGRTALVVAHRLTQAAVADRVVVLEGGRVVQQGTHTDLVATDGPYATLWAAWSVHRDPPSM